MHRRTGARRRSRTSVPALERRVVVATSVTVGPPGRRLTSARSRPGDLRSTRMPQRPVAAEDRRAGWGRNGAPGPGVTRGQAGASGRGRARPSRSGPRTRDRALVCQARPGRGCTGRTHARPRSRRRSPRGGRTRGSRCERSPGSFADSVTSCEATRNADMITRARRGTLGRTHASGRTHIRYQEYITGREQDHREERPSPRRRERVRACAPDGSRQIRRASTATTAPAGPEQQEPREQPPSPRRRGSPPSSEPAEREDPDDDLARGHPRVVAGDVHEPEPPVRCAAGRGARSRARSTPASPPTCRARGDADARAAPWPRSRPRAGAGAGSTALALTDIARPSGDRREQVASARRARRRRAATNKARSTSLWPPPTTWNTTTGFRPTIAAANTARSGRDLAHRSAPRPPSCPGSPPRRPPGSR